MREVNIKNYGLKFGNLTTRLSTKKIIIHHTGNSGVDDDLSAKTIHKSHQNIGWSGIGYHYVVRKDGTIEEGRPHWTIGAHAEGHNSYTIGIHVSGNFEIGKPTAKQIEGLALILAKVGSDYGLPMTPEFVVPHSDLNSTACCGKNLKDVLQTVRGKAVWYQNN